MLPHPLNNLEIQIYYQNEPQRSSVFSRITLPVIKGWAYVINSDDYYSERTYWIALYVNDKNVKYFDSFGVEHIPKEMKKFLGDKKITTKIYKIQV